MHGGSIKCKLAKHAHFLQLGTNKRYIKAQRALNLLGVLSLLCKWNFIRGTAYEHLNDELRQSGHGQWTHSDTGGHQCLETD